MHVPTNFCGTRTAVCCSSDHAPRSPCRPDPANGWCTTGYIFPEGYCSTTKFRSSRNPTALVEHKCSIVGRGGALWPRPTFVVVAADRPDEPIVAKSASGAWKQVQDRLNAEIAVRLEAGEQLQGPSRQQLSGTVFFGLTAPSIVADIEALDPERVCAPYWEKLRVRALCLCRCSAPLSSVCIAFSSFFFLLCGDTESTIAGIMILHFRYCIYNVP